MEAFRAFVAFYNPLLFDPGMLAGGHGYMTESFIVSAARALAVDPEGIVFDFFDYVNFSGFRIYRSPDLDLIYMYRISAPRT